MALGIAAPVAAAVTNDPAPRQQQFASQLAKELGVDEAKVNAALDKLHEDWAADHPADQGRQRPDLKTRLDEAVKEGKLTQAEADAVLKAIEGGVLWPGWDGDWRGHRDGWHDWHGWDGWHGRWNHSADGDNSNNNNTQPGK
jgi:hypothetical protein